jgi:quinol monooxygenase YgiN
LGLVADSGLTKRGLGRREQRNKVTSLADAVALTHSGDTVCTSGFVGIGVPEALLAGLEGGVASDGRIQEAVRSMLIRVVTTRADVPRTGEGIAFVHGEIQPKIAAMDGNAGFAMGVDRSSGRYVSIAVWTDREALEASGHGAPGLVADLARRLHGSEPSVEVFELVLAHLVKPVRLGYWGRLARLEVPVHDLALAAQRYQQWVLALFEHYAGLAAVILFVDRSKGVLECVNWYDSLPVLRGSVSRTQELRDLLVADIPAMKVVEDFELQAVITEMDELSRAVSPTYTWN